MVRLTITPAILAALRAAERRELDISATNGASEPCLDNPALGNPISHGQIIAISRLSKGIYEDLQKAEAMSSEMPASYHLDDLLRGAKIYNETPKPKAKKSPEYTALMARLRREEEDRVYERMIRPPPPAESFAQRFPTSSNSKLFPPATQAELDQDDAITYADINRQMALIINILISIVACSVAIWLAARHWSTPKRLGLSMGGSGMIGVAEVVVYAGYLRRLKEAREKGNKQVEVKEIIKTWIISSEEQNKSQMIPEPTDSTAPDKENIRRRKDHLE